MTDKITLIDTIQHEMESDDSERIKQDLYLIEAYKNRDIDSFLIALCGWSFETLIEINCSDGGTMLKKVNQELLNKSDGA